MLNLIEVEKWFSVKYIYRVSDKKKQGFWVIGNAELNYNPKDCLDIFKRLKSELAREGKILSAFEVADIKKIREDVVTVNVATF